jgi:hypothetical protein
MNKLNARSYILGIATVFAIAAAAYLGGLYPPKPPSGLYQNLCKVGVEIPTLLTQLEQNKNGNKNLVFQYYLNASTQKIDLRGWFYTKGAGGNPWKQAPSEVVLTAGGTSEVTAEDKVLSSAVLYDKTFNQLINALKAAQSAGSTHAIFYPKDTTANNTRFINWKLRFGTAAELAANHIVGDTTSMRFLFFQDSAADFSTESYLNPSPPKGYEDY